MGQDMQMGKEKTIRKAEPNLFAVVEVVQAQQSYCCRLAAQSFCKGGGGTSCGLEGRRSPLRHGLSFVGRAHADQGDVTLLPTVSGRCRSTLLSSKLVQCAKLREQALVFLIECRKGPLC